MTLAEQHEALVRYLSAKIEARDWHAVSDAAIDLQVIEARMKNSDHVERSGPVEREWKYGPWRCTRRGANCEMSDDAYCRWCDIRLIPTVKEAP